LKKSKPQKGDQIIEEDLLMSASHAAIMAKSSEQAWHDKWYDENARKEFPDTAAEFREFFSRVQLQPFCDGGWAYWGDARTEMMRMIGDVRGLEVLDYGCGSGQLGIYLAMQGARVSGFDLSPKGIEVANWAAQKYGLICSFRAMDAEEIDYPSGAFDLAVGFGVLHHVIKYPKSAVRLADVIKPGGRAVFHETLWDNPLINLARRFTMPNSDAGDAHLTERAIRDFGVSFMSTEIHKRNILYMLKRFSQLPDRDLRRPLVPRPFWRGVRTVDQQLIRLGLSRFCGEAIVCYAK
jgi:2-polyprenyl-3-methyl-5-hydroxy-6-metoxy-1,4-benzoquinol methylase